MKLLDSNIIIYSSQEEFSSLRTLFSDENMRISYISKVEVLGFRNLTPNDKVYFEAIFRQIPYLTLTEAVLEEATLLRQQHRLSLGDAIIAATALIHNCTLYTRNISDFSKIKGISVINPMD
jgi:toxin FitB